MQALAILFGALFTVAVSIALGRRLFGAALDPGIQFVAGAAVLSMVVFALCSAGLVYPLVFLAIGLASLMWGRLVTCGRVVLGLVGCVRLPPRPSTTRPQDAILPHKHHLPLSHCLLFLAFTSYFILYFFSSMAPESSFDGAGYHLSFVARYLREHGFHPVTWNLYASLTEGVEMLFLFAFAFGRHSAASMVHFAFLLSLTWQIFAYGRRTGYPMAGACGALVLFASPMIGVDATSAYVDVALAAVAFTVFHLLQIWDTDRSPRLLLAIGLVAGFAYAVKYTGWVAMPYALAFVAWKSRRLRSVLTVALCAAPMVLPWMLKNSLWMLNPLAPFFNHWFPNPYVTPAFEDYYQRYFHTYDLSSLWQIPMQVTTRGHLGGFLGPVFLLAPLALLALRRKEGRALLLAAVVFGANYFSNIGTRFLIPSLPFIALAMALALASVPRLAVGLVVVHALISWPTRVSLYCSADAWHLTRVPIRQALRIKSMDEYLDKNMFFYGVARMVDRNTPPDATVFTYRPIPEAYTSRRILVNYESESNQIAGAMVQAASFPSDAPNWRIRFSFPQQEIVAARLVPTASRHGVLWRLHEVCAFDGTRALDDFAGAAQPYPWTEGSAHDGNPLTFWRSSEWLAPGQFFEMNFRRPEPIDAVGIRTSLDQRDVPLKLEGRTASSAWRLLSDTPEAHEQPGPDLRPAAIEQLKIRGIRYLLSFENEGETRDLRQHADLWGLRELAHNKDARLYQIP